MSEVAERAGISIGSLYQYFPDKARDHPHAGRALQCRGPRLHRGGACRTCATRRSLRDAFGGLVDVYYGMFLAEPVMRDIWSATQADKALRDIDLADSRANGALLAAALAARRARRRSGRDRARPAFLICSWARRRCGSRSRSSAPKATRWWRPTSGWRCGRSRQPNLLAIKPAGEPGLNRAELPFKHFGSFIVFTEGKAPQ